MIEYDNWGRMKYNPELHFKQGEVWDKEELDYLINWLDKIGLEEMSLALGRTETSIATKVHKLRREGLMSKQNKQIQHPRLLKKTGYETIIC